MGDPTFETLFCAHFHCVPSAYRARALALFLYPHTWLVAPILRAVKPEFFDLDFTFIERLGAATEMQDAVNDLMDFDDNNHQRPGWVRSIWRLRVSGRRAHALVRLLFTSVVERPRIE